MLKGRKILIGISGGIAAYKVCSLVRLFVKAGAEVRVIMTPYAAKFVSPLTLSVLSGNEVIINMFPQGDDFSSMEKVDTGTAHIDYGIWSDLFVIAPATANTIAKAASGIADNFLLSTVLSCRAPILIAPTMDLDMYKKEITEENISKLKSRGFFISEPTTGELASGLWGKGRMAEPEEILNDAEKILLRQRDLSGKKILITAGPTREYIDKVRYITNGSTGKMGFAIAKAAAERGAKVTLITGNVSLTEEPGIKRINVETSGEMLKAVKANLKGKDLVIMSAAVEDFKPLNEGKSKIKKETLNDEFSINFGKTTDILKYLGSVKKGFKLYGFALESENGEENAKKKLKNKNLDMIVLNSLNQEGAGFGGDTNIVNLIDKKGIKKLPLMSKYEAGNKILDYYIKSL